MKISKYSYVADTGNKIVVTNFLNGNLLVFQDNAYEKFKDQHNSSLYDEQYLSLLTEKGIIVDENTNEEEVLENVTREIVEQEKRLRLTILVTEQCNFRCKYCCEKFENGKIAVETLDKIYSFLEKNIAKYNYLTVEWFGGEPTLAVDRIEYLSNKIIDLCRKHHVSYGAMMSTNGYLLDAEMVNRLRKLFITGFQVTIDGLKNTHNMQRVLASGEGTWDQIINNLRDVRDNVKSSAFHIMLRVNITHEIYKNRKQFLEFLKNEFAGDLRFHFIWKLAEDWGNMSDENKDMLCGLMEYQGFVEDANDLGLRTRFTGHMLKPGKRICESAKKNSLVIFSDGTIGKCARNEKPDISHIGTVNDLEDKPAYLLNKVIESDSSKCNGCIKLPLCMGRSCPLNVEEPCGYDMKNIDFTLRCIADTDDTITRIKQ